MFGYRAKATLNEFILDIADMSLQDSALWFIGFDSMLYTHISPDSSTLNCITIQRGKKQKPKCS